MKYEDFSEEDKTYCLNILDITYKGSIWPCVYYLNTNGEYSDYGLMLKYVAKLETAVYVLSFFTALFGLATAIYTFIAVLTWYKRYKKNKMLNTSITLSDW